MATLTWRNVAAPSFSGSLDGLRTAGALLNNAVGTAQQGIGAIQGQNQEAVDNAVMQRALALQGADQYTRALQDGSVLGPDAGRVSADTLRSLDNRASTLLQRAAIGEGLRQTQYENQRGRAADARLDQANPDVQAALNLARNNDQAGLQRLLQSSESLRNLGPEQFAALLGQADSFASNSQGRIQTGQDIRETDYAYGRTAQQDRDADAAAQALVDTVRSSATQGDAAAAADQILPSLSGPAGAQYLQQLSGAGFTPYAPVDSAAPQSGGTPGTRSGGAFNTTFNFTPTEQPITQLPIRDVLDVQSGLLNQHGASPVGAFQINRGTLEDYAPRVLGDNWRDQPLSAENQDKIAKRIFDDRKSGDLTKTWAALPNSTPGAYADMSWEEMRDQIAQAETGQSLPPSATNAAGNNQASSLASRAIAERVSQDTSGGRVASNYDNLLNNNASVTEAANSLRTGDNAPLSGTSQNFLEDQIQYVQQQSGNRLNPTQAAAMIADSVEQQPDTFFGGLGRDIAQGMRFINPFSDTNRNTPDLGNGRLINNDRLQSAIDQYVSGNSSLQAASTQSLAQLSSMVQSAQAAYNQALQQYNAIRSAARNRPSGALSGSLQRAQQTLDAAEQRLQGLLSQLPADSTISPRFDRTQ